MYIDSHLISKTASFGDLVLTEFLVFEVTGIIGQAVMLYWPYPREVKIDEFWIEYNVLNNYVLIGDEWSDTDLFVPLANPLPWYRLWEITFTLQLNDVPSVDSCVVQEQF